MASFPATKEEAAGPCYAAPRSRLAAFHSTGRLLDLFGLLWSWELGYCGFRALSGFQDVNVWRS